MHDHDGTAPHFGGATGGIRTLLRLEGLALTLACIAGYGAIDAPWWLFLVLFFAPDLSFVAFLAGHRIGAIAYDAAHTSIGPLVLGVAGFLTEADLAVSLALIWGSHVGIDRAIGYGLRYPASVRHTHLGAVGRPSS